MPQLASAATNGETLQQEDLSGPPAANRHRLPDERAGITHHFSIAGHSSCVFQGKKMFDFLSACEPISSLSIP